MALLSSAISGVKWSSFSQIGRQTLQLITTIVLARTLAPSDFGLMSMAMVVIGFLNIFRDLGTSSAIIQRKDISNKLLSSIFWVNVGFGVLVTLVVYFLAPIIAEFYNDLRLTLLLKVLSATFLISSVGISHQALLERNLEFSKLAWAEIAATLLGASVGIGFAFAGAGVWSLVFQALSTAVISTLLLSFFLDSWRPSFLFDIPETRAVARFSLNLSGFNITNYFVRNADYLLIGKFLGAQELGYYSLAYRIMLYPLQNVTAVISRVMFPVYSRIRDENDKFRKGYLKVAGSIALITFPMMLGMIGVSDCFVSVFFGEKWRVVSLLLMIFSPIGLLQSIEATTGTIYLAQSRTDWMFRWGMATGIFSVICFVIGLRWGIVGVASSYMVGTILLAYPGFLIPFKLINLKVVDLLRGVWRPFVCSVVMLIAVFCGHVLLEAHVSPSQLLAILLFIGLGTYAINSSILNRADVQNMLAYLRQ